MKHVSHFEGQLHNSSLDRLVSSPASFDIHNPRHSPMHPLLFFIAQLECKLIFSPQIAMELRVRVVCSSGGFDGFPFLTRSVALVNTYRQPKQCT